MTAVLQTETSCVVACSALRRTYRDVLRQAATAAPTAEVRFAFLDVDRDTLRERIIARHGHFMHASMLASQLKTLEVPGPDENAVSVEFSNAMTPASAADAIVATLPAAALGGHRSSVFRMPRPIDDL
jgi:gluconokinase